MIRTNNATGYGNFMQNEKPPDWEEVLSSAARLQQILPDLESRFDSVLEQLESVAGWQTARVKRPVMILGSLDGIETGVRQLIRSAPLETTQLEFNDVCITVPTEAEILRIKGILILKRNATRDYLDFAALADHMGTQKFFSAISRFDELYPQENNESALLQLQIQLAEPLPFDLEETRLDEYKNIRNDWADWKRIREICINLALSIFDFLAEE
jgi:hypothetical protein